MDRTDTGLIHCRDLRATRPPVPPPPCNSPSYHTYPTLFCASGVVLPSRLRSCGVREQD